MGACHDKSIKTKLLAVRLPVYTYISVCIRGSPYTYRNSKPRFSSNQSQSFVVVVFFFNERAFGMSDFISVQSCCWPSGRFCSRSYRHSYQRVSTQRAPLDASLQGPVARSAAATRWPPPDQVLLRARRDRVPHGPRAAPTETPDTGRGTDAEVGGERSMRVQGYWSDESTEYL